MKKVILFSLISSLVFFSLSLSCNAEKINDEVLSKNDVSEENLLSLNAYYNSEVNKVFSELCIFSDECMPKIYCSYDNENFILTDASIVNKFSFTPNEGFDEIHVKAIQTLNDGTQFESKTVKISINENILSIAKCSDCGDDLGYIPDEHLGEPITVIPRSFGYVFYLYPDSSYFSETGKACTCHSYCNWNNPGDCTVFDNAIQCEGFAKRVYYEMHDKLLTTRTNYNGSLTAAKARSLFQGNYSVNMGTYLRVKTNNGYDHSLIITFTFDDSVTIYHANYGGPCKVRYQSYTWEAFAKAFPYLYYYTK